MAKEWPVPHDPLNLRACFIWCQMEDDTCQIPAHIQANYHLAGNIHLLPEVKGDMLVLTGSMEPYIHPLLKTPITGHDNGMIFQIKCMNMAEEVRGALLWKRVLTKNEVSDMSSCMVHNVQGLIPAMGKHFGYTLKMVLAKHGPNLSIESVSIEIPLASYKYWIEWWSH